MPSGVWPSISSSLRLTFSNAPAPHWWYRFMNSLSPCTSLSVCIYLSTCLNFQFGGDCQARDPPMPCLTLWETAVLNNGWMMDGRRKRGEGVLELLRAGDNIHQELSREMKVRGTCQGVTHTWIMAGKNESNHQRKGG